MSIIQDTSDWFTLSDGLKLYERTWESPSPRAHIVILHGYSETADLYNAWSRALIESFPLRVTAFDRRGWGKSAHEPSQRGLTGKNPQSLTELNEYLHHVISKFYNDSSKPPIFLMGHSMGGQESLYYLLQQTLPPSPSAIPDQRGAVSGLILDAPYIGLDPEVAISPLTILFGKLLTPFFPWYQVKHKPDGSTLCRDPVVCKEWNGDDEVCHGMATLEGFQAMFERETALMTLTDRNNAVPDSLKHRLPIPMFWAHGTADKATSFTLSKKLFDRFNDGDGDGVKVFKSYEGWYHALHLEPDGMKEQFARDVGEWIGGIIHI